MVPLFSRKAYSLIIMPYQAPRGTKDILPNDISSWQAIEEASRRLFFLYNYKEIRTPLIEDALLFKRSLGDATEIVNKQMFMIEKGDDLFVLRPEATASIARAYLEHNLGQNFKLNKLFYIGPMFRAERPQKGRLRQFHHIGVEAIGSFSPFLDIEIIGLANDLLKKIGIEGYTILVNSLGCRTDKGKFSDLLMEELAGRKDSLCPDCQERFSRNVFRVLDCKKDSCRNIVSSLSLDKGYLCDGCREHFDTVTDGLKRINLNFRIERSLVRGLDYYSGVVFEITHPGLGAQDALGAGGRYDYLFSELANKEIGGVGFAFGVERILLAKENVNPEPKLDIYIIALGKDATFKGQELLAVIREKSISCDLDYSESSLKSKLNEANKIGARFSIIIGDNELKKDSVIIRDMAEGTQEEINLADLLKYVRGKIC